MSEIDPDSATWRAVREWAEGRLRMQRAQLEQRGLPADETEACRAAIEELEALLKLTQPSRLPPQLPMTEPV